MLKRTISLLLTLILLLPAMALGEATPEPAQDINAPASAEDIPAAMEVYAWFVMTPLAVDEKFPSPDGTMYLLKDETLRHTTDMQARLDQYFSTEISQSLWAWGAYQDVNGELYGYRKEDSPYAREVDGSIAEIVFKVMEETYKKRVYNAVLYDTSDGSTVYEFVSEYVGGRWIFTEFPYIW